MQEFVFQMDPQSKQPLYRQLYQYLIEEIRGGNLRPGEKLPGKKSLAAHLGLSQSTVETAYGMLAAEGYVEARPRSGCYVRALEKPPLTALRPLPPPLKKTSPRSYRYSLLSGNIDTAVFPFSTWAKITREALYDDQELLRYGHSQGEFSLRAGLCKYLHEFRGVNCRPDQVIIGAGLEYLVPLVCRLLGKETKFALEDPAYPKTVSILRNAGAPLCFLPVDKEGLSLSALETSGAAAAYITPSHQFPLGVVMPVGRRLGMLRWAAQSPDRYIIEDDYDSEFRYNGAPIPALQGLDENGKVIYVGTFSRSIAPAFRLAYMVLPDSLLCRYETLFSAYSSTVSRLDQKILERFLAEGSFRRHLNRMRNVYRQRRDALVRAFAVSPLAPRLTVLGENAGLHFLLRVDLGLSSEELAAAADRVGVQLLPLSAFYSYQRPPEGVVVVGFAGLLPTDAPQVVELLTKAWLPV